MSDLSNQVTQSSLVWVPCIPNYATGELIPLYTINNFPQYKPPVQLKATISRGGIKSKEWNHIEDQKLIELVNQFGTKQWGLIAKEINRINENSSRKGKHCRERWYNHLNPEINSKFYVEGEWSYEEDLIILNNHKIFGNKWSKIAKLLKGSTENSVKNRLNSLIKNGKQNLGFPYISDEAIIDIIAEQISKVINK